MATETTNYKFRKPAENEYYDVGVQNQNWDDADMSLKELDEGKVDSAGGDIAATKVGSITASTASYPVPAANDTVKVGFGKIAKFFGDIRNWMTGVCLIGQIVNNCVTNNAGLPLSAAQGKVLMDLFTKLNSDYAVLKNSGWNTMNLNPQLYSQTSYFIWNKKGNLVTIKAYLVFLSDVNVYAGSYINLSELPAGCNPITSFYECGAVDSNLNPLLCHFQSAGQIRIKSNTDKVIRGMFLSTSYLAG